MVPSGKVQDGALDTVATGATGLAGIPPIEMEVASEIHPVLVDFTLIRMVVFIGRLSFTLPDWKLSPLSKL